MTQPSGHLHSSYAASGIINPQEKVRVHGKGCKEIWVFVRLLEPVSCGYRRVVLPSYQTAKDLILESVSPS